MVAIVSEKSAWQRRYSYTTWEWAMSGHEPLGGSAKLMLFPTTREL